MPSRIAAAVTLAGAALTILGFGLLMLGVVVFGTFVLTVGLSGDRGKEEPPTHLFVILIIAALVAWHASLASPQLTFRLAGVALVPLAAWAGRRIPRGLR